MNKDVILKYSLPKSDQTLRQGLIEYYKAHPHLNLGHQFLGQNKAIVLSHDICHVLFGCGAKSADELIVETWTVLGTKITYPQYAYMIKSGLFQEIIKTFGFYRLAKRLVLTLPRVLATVYFSQVMRKKWDHFGCAKLADLKLVEVRSIYGIRIV